MDLVWIVYLIDVILPALKLESWHLVLSGIVLSLVYVFSNMFISDMYKSEQKEYRSRLNNIFKRFVLPVYVFFLVPWWVVGKFIPAEDTAYKMLAAYGATELVQMEQTQELGGKAFDVVNKILDDYLVEETTDGN